MVLLSPSLQGHRLIYCRVLAAIFARAGRDVVVAGDLGADGVAGHPLLAELGERSGVSVVDAGPVAAFSAAALPALLRDAGAEELFCADADGLIGDPAFTRAALPGVRTVGLYVRTTNYLYTARSSRRRGLRRRRRGAPEDVAFHEGGPAAVSPVDAALVLDERFAAEHPLTHRWMPDIFREPDGDGGEQEETARWRARVTEMLARVPRRPVVVYVGTNQERRGYDTLLRLAAEEDAAFLHCGRLEPHDGDRPEEVERLPALLLERGALLETAGPYVRPETADVFLRAGTCVALPYRRHLGSSGVMLQAAAAGRPVVVPDEGLMAFRTASFGLGITYAAGDDRALRRAFRALLSRRPEAYAPRLRAFTACFAPARVEAAVLAGLTGSGPGAELPQHAFAMPSPGRRQPAWS